MNLSFRLRDLGVLLLNVLWVSLIPLFYLFLSLSLMAWLSVLILNLILHPQKRAILKE